MFLMKCPSPQLIFLLVARAEVVAVAGDVAPLSLANPMILLVTPLLKVQHQSLVTIVVVMAMSLINAHHQNLYHIVLNTPLPQHQMLIWQSLLPIPNYLNLGL